ncbi:Sugar transport protein [Thalictrum thalictroides]|uniref:Sugar transport protein n=1 Tax=Thalictrum thalictroides TaxID=46969 RepID=A0A7J6X5I5_THATH|nr:Sugar transport protein [Thalictrum thalictroides]
MLFKWTVACDTCQRSQKWCLTVLHWCNLERLLCHHGLPNFTGEFSSSWYHSFSARNSTYRGIGIRWAAATPGFFGGHLDKQLGCPLHATSHLRVIVFDRGKVLNMGASLFGFEFLKSQVALYSIGCFWNNSVSNGDNSIQTWILEIGLTITFFASYTTRMLGRRLTMLIASVFFIVGVILNATAQDLVMLIIGVGFAN